MKEIRLTNGAVALVDDEDFESLSKFTWHLYQKGYARRRWTDKNTGKRIPVLMHRQILGLSYGDGIFTDHIDGNGLNNQRINLRTCTPAENNRNRRVSKNSSTGLKGVFRRPRAKGDRFMAAITHNNKSVYLGTFDTPEEAHQAYCSAAKLLYGEFASSGE